MPFILAMWSAFAAIALPLVIRVLAGLGLGVATYAGVKELLDYALEQIQSMLGGIGADLLIWLGVFRIDQFITIVFSAMVVRLTFMGLTAAGTITRMQWRAPAGGA